VFPATGSLLAPAWVLERAACSWLALGCRVLRGGVDYAGRRITVAAHSKRALRRRLAARSAPGIGRRQRPEAAQLVGAVAEGLEG
jgi:hypothetical protein